METFWSVILFSFSWAITWPMCTNTHCTSTRLHSGSSASSLVQVNILQK